VQTPAFYDTLFGDLPLAEWARHGDRLDTEPWPAFVRAAELVARRETAQACRTLHEIAGMPHVESRHQLQAWSALREIHCPEARRAERTVIGVVVEAAAEHGPGNPGGGHDILAVYQDRSALYLDHSGSVATWTRPNASLDEEIAAVLQAAADILPRIGPWSDKRLPPPQQGNVRLDILTPIGLCFGEGPFAAIARDPVGAPLVKAGATLVHRLSMLPKATVN
jgi:hypothetical protein